MLPSSPPEDGTRSTKAEFSESGIWEAKSEKSESALYARGGYNLHLTEKEQRKIVSVGYMGGKKSIKSVGYTREAKVEFLESAQ